MMQAQEKSAACTVPAPAIKQHFNIVVAGEFNSGKSSVVNLLLRKDVMPVSLGASGFPPASIQHADNETYDIRSAHSGQVFGKTDLFSQHNQQNFRSISIETSLENFLGAAIFEVSVEEDGTVSPKGYEILADADLLIWCTMGQRSWCLSEISVVETLPHHLLESAILAVTRSDYLQNSNDINKVERRLKLEASDFFETILMIDSSRKTIAAVSDRDVWEKSGGKGLLANVIAKFKDSPFYGKAPVVARNGADEVHQTHKGNVDNTISLAEIYSAWASELTEVEVWVDSQSEIPEVQFAKHIQKRLLNFSGAVLPMASRATANHDRVIAFEKAERYLRDILSIPEQPNIAVLAADLSLQLLRELGSSVHELGKHNA